MAKPAQYDVLGIGNAIVDVIAPVEDGFLKAQDITKASMTLIDEARANQLYDAFPPASETSGGSAANTIAGAAGFGAKTSYFGKVADDQLGDTFTHDLCATGTAFNTAPLVGGPGTARCLIAVTPDAQRSMSTYLGASCLFGANDLDEDIIRASAITYMEGYLFDKDEAKAAFVRAAEIAAQAGRKTALTLSDLFCVDRHRSSFLHLVRGHIDILFANEAELLALYETDDFESALQNVRKDCAFAAITRSEKGSVLIHEGQTVIIKAEPVERVLDTTGAGDLYAAGVLYGISNDLPLAECGRLGSIAAAEIISHYGARAQTDLRALAGFDG
jgi:sugar/nucleoside kinase (ribokinase family)